MTTSIEDEDDYVLVDWLTDETPETAEDTKPAAVVVVKKASVVKAPPPPSPQVVVKVSPPSTTSTNNKKKKGKKKAAQASAAAASLTTAGEAVDIQAVLHAKALALVAGKNNKAMSSSMFARTCAQSEMRASKITSKEKHNNRGGFW